MQQANVTYYKRDFWAKENLNYVKPHFRMEKAARLVNGIGLKDCDLLDVGCGPASLEQLLLGNIHYHGIDIAIQQPAPNLLQSDFAENPIQFGDMRFDIVVAQGVFEYIGTVQDKKFSEIATLLNENGTFLVSYVNFGHRNRNIYWPYNNIQSFEDFHGGLARHFQVERYFPTSHRWVHDEPRGRLARALNKHINVNIPFVSRRFAVEYFFICKKK